MQLEQPSKRHFKNHESALSHPDVVNTKFSKEINSHRMIGPHDVSPFVDHCISPVGVRSKKEPNQYRVIHDLSSPRDGISINSQIPDHLATVSYADVPAAIRLIQSVGQGAVMSKTDIEHAYKLLPVHPEDIPALGILWDNQLYFDCTLPMGSRSGCALFEKFATALEYIAWDNGCGPLCHILDDFFFVSRSAEEADKKLQKFLNICKYLGIPIATAKTQSGTCITFMGIELDTMGMQARLPVDKLDKCKSLLEKYQLRRSISIEELESLTGLLNFACSVVTPGRPFLRRLYQLMWGLKRRKPYFRVKLTKGAKEDLRMWQYFLTHYNGVTMFLPNSSIEDSTLHLFTDASGSLGFGLILKPQFAYSTWPESWKKHNIVLLELYPILLAFKMFRKKLQNMRVILHTDNQALVHIINNQTSKDPNIMVLVRDLVLTLLQNNTEVTAVYISTKNNYLADALSRLQVDVFHEMAPWAEELPTPIPESLLPKNYDITYNSY